MKMSKKKILVIAVVIAFIIIFILSTYFRASFPFKKNTK